MSDTHHTDCKTDDGTTVGMIDAIMTLARCLVERNLTTPAADAAMRDLRQDPDVLKLLGFERTENPTRATAPERKLGERDPDQPLIPCPKCGTPTSFDHTGILCVDPCFTIFCSELPDDEAEALASTDPDHVAWIEKITGWGWKPKDGTLTLSKLYKVDAIPFDQLPEDHPARRPPPATRRKTPTLPEPP